MIFRTLPDTPDDATTSSPDFRLAFFVPLATALLDSGQFTKRWEPGGPWR